MQKLKSKINAAVIVTVALIYSGCAHLSDSATDASAAPDPAVASDQYSQEIVELNHVVKQNSNPTQTKNAHLELAQLHAHFKNPSRNYHKALRHLKVYSASEDSAKDDETRNWLAALKEIERLSKEIVTQNKQIQQLQIQLNKSKKAKLALKSSNRKLTSEEIKLRDRTESSKNPIKNCKKPSKCSKNSISASKKKGKALTISRRKKVRPIGGKNGWNACKRIESEIPPDPMDYLGCDVGDAIHLRPHLPSMGSTDAARCAS
jgi:hypothetical protein